MEESGKDSKELLPPSTKLETAYDMAAAVSSIAPWIGGPVSAVLSGISASLKMERIQDVLLGMAEQVKDLESDVAAEYVRSDEFQELLERTLKQVVYERNEEKRKAYAAFLAGDIKSPGASYDEKARILRTLEEIQADHIRVLKAMMQEPAQVSGTVGSIAQTLQKRLPAMPRERIMDLAQQLADMRLATLENMGTMMTPQGAEDLRSRITTPYGQQFLRYIVGDARQE